MTHATPKERRWIVLSDDGRHVTLGRHTDPSEEEINRAGDGFREMGRGGWLAILDGAYYGRGSPALMMVRPLGVPPSVTWKEAVKAFQAARRLATAETHVGPGLG